MITVKDVMADNEDQQVEVRRALSRDTCEPMRETLYEGALYQIPQELQGLEVLETGQSISKGLNVITVFKA